MGEIASEGFLRKRLASPTILTTVAEEGGKIVGFASVRKVGEGEGELSGMSVLESARGRGVGSRLLRKTLETARRRGFGSILAKTELANERAINFYRKAGFTESGKSIGRIGGTSLALRVMVRRLRDGERGRRPLRKG